MIMNSAQAEHRLRRLRKILDDAIRDRDMHLSVAEWLELVTLIDDLHETLRKRMCKPGEG